MDVQAADDTHAATMIEALSINEVPARRTKGAPMARGVAPHTSSDMFKGPVSGFDVSRERTDARDSNTISPKPSDGTVSPRPPLLRDPS